MTRWKSTIERFWEQTRKTKTCWLWNGAPVTKRVPHGRIYFNGRPHLVHRFAYEQFIGPIPEKFDVHHSCRNPRCVNPSHLIAMPHEDHSKVHAPEIPHRKKDFCPRGHPLSGRNLAVNNKNTYWCAECLRAKQWLRNRGLRISDFKTAAELAAVVPPRGGPRGRYAKDRPL